jgi:hypothetical protein
MLQTKVVEKIKIHLMFRNIIPKIVRFGELMWKNMVEPGRLHNIIRRMRFSCWITKAIDTHLGYVILTTFLRQQWLRERGSMLRYTCAAFLISHLMNNSVA